MIANYLKVALRNILRNKLYSFINIAGLSISLALVLLIASYAQFEMSMNKFNKNYDRIYKVGKGNTPAPVADLIKSNFPQIKDAARIESFRTTSVTMKYGDKVMTVKNIIFSDPDFFDIFTFPALRGDPRAAMTEPMALVLTESEAKTIFGNEDPIGKVVKMDNQFDLTVKAIIRDIPGNSSMQFSGVVSFVSIKKMIGNASFDPNSWTNYNYETYVLFPRQCNKQALTEEIESVVKSNAPPYVRKDLDPSLYPFKDVYYDHDLSSFSSHGSLERNFALISIAILVLLIAMVNYVNLSTARVSTRNKEAGVRKTIGASRSSLIVQFLSESVVVSVIAMVAAVLIALVLIELFGNLIGDRLSVFPGSVLIRCMILLVAAAIIGFLSGLYPAFYLTSFKPDSVLKGNIHHGQGKAFLRKALIVSQFSITVALIISTLTIYRQMEYVRTKPLGFQKENIIYFPVNQEIYSKRDAFANKILQLHSVEGFAYSSAVPGKMGMTWGMPLEYNGTVTRANFHSVPASGDFIKLMGMKIIQGRNFFDRDSSDLGNVIVNQAFVNRFGLSNPFEAKLTGFGEDKGKIVGVVKDFNFESLRSPIEPLAFFNMPDYINYAVIRVKAASYAGISSDIREIKTIWKKIAPDFPMGYHFLDQTVERQYRAEEEFESALFWFSLFAVLIACLGLFGLTAYTVEQRTKEISVRKILGATTGGITFMLSKQFVVLVLFSNIVAWPVAYYVTNNWLRNFAFRINMSAWVFICAAVLALFIAFATTGYHAIKAATANPVECLRYE